MAKQGKRKREERKPPRTFVYKDRERVNKEKGQIMIARLAVLAQHTEAAIVRARASLEELRKALGKA